MGKDPRRQAIRGLDTDRQGFLELLSRRQVAPSRKRLGFVGRGRAGQLRLLWGQDRRDGDPMPSVIQCRASEMHDLLAWGATYLGDYRPWTAYCRVLPFEQPIPSGACGSPVTSAAQHVALVVAEAIIQTGQDPRRIETTTYASTLSFVMARGLAVEQDPQQLSSLLERWKALVQIARSRRQARQGRVIAEVWSFALGLDAPAPTLFETISSPVHRAVQTVQAEGEIPLALLAELFPPLGATPTWEAEMAGRMEQRVKFLSHLAGSRAPEPGRSLVFGYLASKLADGLDHWRLCLQAGPSALLWYAWFAGERSPTAVFGAFGGIARLLRREIEAANDVLRSPSHDIAFDELALLAGEDHPRLDFRTRRATELRVELAPTVVATVSWGIREGARPPVSSEVRRRVDAAQSALSSAAASLADVQRLIERGE